MGIAVYLSHNILSYMYSVGLLHSLCLAVQVQATNNVISPNSTITVLAQLHVYAVYKCMRCPLNITVNYVISFSDLNLRGYCTEANNYSYSLCTQ